MGESRDEESHPSAIVGEAKTVCGSRIESSAHLVAVAIVAAEPGNGQSLSVPSCPAVARRWPSGLGQCRPQNRKAIELKEDYAEV
jgi:hypothetical protein